MPKIPDIYFYLIKICTTSVADFHKTETISQKDLYEETVTPQPQLNRKSHIPKHSVFFEKIVPVALILLGMITLGLILFAAGVLLGIIQF